MNAYRIFLPVTVAVISALAVSSCAYDPYYSGTSYSSGYGNDYGSGYGYGSRSFTTTHFVRTSSPRWGYDPYARCYYDYTRRSYYDPYLSGYYPVGYRPRYVQGAPHPHGWSSGSRSIAPPSRFRDYRLDNYQNRSERYRSLNNSWSRNVHVNNQNRVTDSHRSHQTSSYDRNYDSRNRTYSGSNQEIQRSQTYSRNTGPFVNDSKNDRRPESRKVETKKESPKPTWQKKETQNERNSRSNRQAEINKERSIRSNVLVKSEANRQPDSRSSNKARSDDNRQRQESTSRGSGRNDERTEKRR